MNSENKKSGKRLNYRLELGAVKLSASQPIESAADTVLNLSKLVFIIDHYLDMLLNFNPSIVIVRTKLMPLNKILLLLIT